jgi:hypothetical protein
MKGMNELMVLFAETSGSLGNANKVAKFTNSNFKRTVETTNPDKTETPVFVPKNVSNGVLNLFA